MAVVAALGAAVLYALASVLQQKAAAEQPPQRALRVGLLVGLAARRTWLAGIAADGAAFVLQFVALSHGSLVLVQPLLVSGLLLAVPLSVALHRCRPARVDWSGSALVAAGLALFLVVAQPKQGDADTTAWTWVLLLTATVVPAAALALAGRARRGALAAGLLAASGGVIYGLTAALTKVVGHLLGRGVLHVVTAWQTYALVVLGVAGMVVVQSAFQVGPLAWSLPTLTVADPVVSIAIGAFAFGEHVASGPLSTVLELVGLSAVAAGVYTLAGSPSMPGVGYADDRDPHVQSATSGPVTPATGAPRAPRGRDAQPEDAVEAVEAVDAVDAVSPRSTSTGPMRSSKLSQ